MNLDTHPMPPDVRQQAKRLLDQIRNSKTMLEAVRKGSLAEGFVLGMATLKAIPADTLEQLDLLFSQETDDQLMVLSDPGYPISS